MPPTARHSRTRSPARRARTGSRAGAKARPKPQAKRAPRTPLLAKAEQQALGRRIPQWRVKGKQLVRETDMADFDAAMAFLSAIAGLARRADHHPDLHLTGYRKVRVELSSHDAGGLTVRDYSLAEEIDRLPGAWSPKARAARSASPSPAGRPSPAAKAFEGPPAGLP